MTILPQCYRCRHLVLGDRSMSCLAFDGEIPEAILLNEHDHRYEYPNDRGYRFEAKQTDEPLDDATKGSA